MSGHFLVNKHYFFVSLQDEVTDEERDEADEKNRLINQVLELQNTLDGK